jgi:hypothetical protein
MPFRCTACRQEKPARRFHQAQKRDGLVDRTCKQCLAQTLAQTLARPRVLNDEVDVRPSPGPDTAKRDRKQASVVRVAEQGYLSDIAAAHAQARYRNR